MRQMLLSLVTIIPLSQTFVAVTNNSTINVSYLVTNNDKQSHTFMMQPIDGVNQNNDSSNCASTFALAPSQSCTLSLDIRGSNITNAILGGPVLCTQENPSQCYTPTSNNILQVTKTNSQTTYTVAVFVSGLNGNLVLQNNAKDNLAISTNGAFSFATALTAGSSYNVTILTQPNEQVCTLSNASGAIQNHNINNISVSCKINTEIDKNSYFNYAFDRVLLNILRYIS